MSKNPRCKCGREIDITVPMYTDDNNKLICKACFNELKLVAPLKKSKYTNKDIEAFTLDLGRTIHDLNKKHNDILHRINLDNSMVEFFRFLQKTKEASQEKEECDT